MSSHSFRATRPAPPRPTSSPYIPPNHPFSTYYTPPSTPSTPKTSSYRTTPPSSPGSISMYSTSSSDTYAEHEHKPLRSLAAPLSSRPRPRPPITQSKSSWDLKGVTQDLGHYSSGYNHPTPAYSQPPSDLAFLDSRPRQTLLKDLEFIFGKKLSFPVLNRLLSSSSSTTTSTSSVSGRSVEEKKRKEVKEKKQARKLSKERTVDVSWEEDFEWDGDRLVDTPARKYRGVKEGNWI